MAVLLVTFELKTEGKDYKPFHDAIQKNANGWMHYIENVWVVNTEDSADAFARKLFPHMTQQDSLLVVKITAEHQGWLPKDAWEWLNARNY